MPDTPITVREVVPPDEVTIEVHRCGYRDQRRLSIGDGDRVTINGAQYIVHALRDPYGGPFTIHLRPVVLT